MTNTINEKLHNNGIADGFIIIFSPHTTAGLIINEAESGLMNDIERLLSSLLPDDKFEHDKIDNNAKSHLTATLLNTSLIVPIQNGRLALGTWQSVIFCELDGPRRRNLIIRTLPEQ